MISCIPFLKGTKLLSLASLRGLHYILKYLFLLLSDTVRKIQPPGELMKKDKLVEISGGKLVVADVSTASAAIIKANDARGVAVASV